MEICCENPYNLLNPYASEFLSKYKKYIWKGVYYELTFTQAESLKHSFKRKLFPDGFYTRNLTKDECDNCLIVKDDGTTIPLVFQVPCGRCEVCKERKGKEWQSRCACESLYSSSPTLFVTLTFNDIHLPTDGVCKRHLQLFFKRLRKTFDNHELENCLRYFAVAEYGDNYGRPHYHILFWNLPNVHIWKLIRMIEDAWSFEVDYDRYIKLRDVERLCRYEKKYNRHTRKYELVRVYRERIGIAEAELARDKSGAYAALYMGSDHNPLKYPNPTFYLASRGNGGLGYKWCDDNMSLYRTKVDMTSIELPTEKGTKHYRIPRYFVNRWFPVRSQVVPKDVVSAYKAFSYIAFELIDFEKQLSNPNYIFKLSDIDLSSLSVYLNGYIPERISEIKQKYFFMPDLISIDHNSDFSDFYSCLPEFGIENFISNMEKFDELFQYLIDYQIDNNKLTGHLLKEKRTDLIQSVSARFDSLPLEDVKLRIKESKNLRKIKSMF